MFKSVGRSPVLGFANDLYIEDIGKRIFPIIWLGAPWERPWIQINSWLVKPLGVDPLCSSARNPVVCIFMTVLSISGEIRKLAEQPGGLTPARTNAGEKNPGGTPHNRGGAFPPRLSRARYLLLVALVIGNLQLRQRQTASNMIGRVISNIATSSSRWERSSARQIPGRRWVFRNYQFLTSILTIVIQLFLGAYLAIFKMGRIGGALLFP